MHRPNLLVARQSAGVLILLAVLLSAFAAAAAAQGYPNAHLLVEAEWLQERLGDPNLVVVDLRPANQYAAAHIPGSVSFAGNPINDPDHPVAGWLLGPEPFQELMRGLGINDDSHVVIVGRPDSLDSARLFFALELYGHWDKTSILNGGWAAWTAAGGPISRAPAEIQPGDFTARKDENRVATLAYLNERIGQEGVFILDARSAGEYAGTDVRSARGGHVPGAVNLEWVNNVTESGRFKSYEELEALYQAAGVRRDHEIIPYCQTNVRSAHVYFALRLMDYANVRPYEGSWSEWGNNPHVPVETL